MNFNVHHELLTLKNQTKMIRKRAYKVRKSQLDKYQFELIELKKSGASIAELQRWLHKNKHHKCAHSTVLRWFKKNG